MADALQDMLKQAGVRVTKTELRKRTHVERSLAERWAYEMLYVEPAQRKPMPAWLRPYLKT